MTEKLNWQKHALPTALVLLIALEVAPIIAVVSFMASVPNVSAKGRWGRDSWRAHLGFCAVLVAMAFGRRPTGT